MDELNRSIEPDKRLYKKYTIYRTFNSKVIDLMILDTTPNSRRTVSNSISADRWLYQHPSSHPKCGRSREFWTQGYGSARCAAPIHDEADAQEDGILGSQGVWLLGVRATPSVRMVQ